MGSVSMDIFEKEQLILDNALAHIEDVKNGASHSFEEYVTLTKNYNKMLKHLRRLTKFSDKSSTELHESNKNLVDKVHYDALTEIYNRRYMEEQLAKLIKTLSRSGSWLSVMILDIDFFKKYNDTYGHAAGDDCLKSVAKTLAGVITREDDFVARYGGEEFVIVLPHTDVHGAHVTASRVLERILEQNIPHAASEVADCVTVSIGVTSMKPKPGHKGADYIAHADNALYSSKRNGRNRYTYTKYDEAMYKEPEDNVVLSIIERDGR